MPLPASAFPLRVSGPRILGADGSPVLLAGVNWGGAQQDEGVPYGLDRLPVSVLAGKIAAMGLNHVRVPFATGHILTNKGNPVTTAVPAYRVTANPGYAGMTAWQVLREFTDELTAAGLYVVLNNHMNYPGWCPVPLSVQILTRSGWKSWDEVQEGDETLGWAGDGNLAWTPVLAVTNWGPRSVVRIGNKNWTATCTPDHRWLARRWRQRYVKGSGRENPRHEGPRWHEPEAIHAREWTAGPWQLQLTGYAPGGKNGCTPEQAAILAWVLSDGSHGYAGRNSAHFQACVYQKKEPHLSRVRELLRNAGAYSSESVDPRNGVTKLRLLKSYIEPLWDYFGIDRDLSGFILGLSRESRAAWLQAWIDADGWNAGGNSTRQVAKGSRAKIEAVALTAFLEGYLPVIHKGTGGTFPGSGQRGPYWMVSLRTKAIGSTRNARVIYENAGTEDVWCPTTGLGSWVARDAEGKIFLTGNCSEADNNGFWWNDNWPASVFIKCWETVAERFAGNPLVGYDIRNEPRKATIGGIQRVPAWGGGGSYDFRQMYEVMTSLITARDPDCLCFCEGLSYASDLTGWKTAPVRRPNAVASLHDYPWFHKGVTGYAAYKAAMDTRFPDLGVPVWVGEFGTNTDVYTATLESGWLPWFVRYAGERGWGWCWWELSATAVAGTEPTTNAVKMRYGQREAFSLLAGQDWGGIQADVLRLLAPILPVQAP